MAENSGNGPNKPGNDERILWPDMSTPEGQARGLQLGAAAAGFMAVGYVYDLYRMIGLGEPVHGPQLSLLSLPVLVGILALLILSGWRLFKRASLLAASLILAVAFFESCRGLIQPHKGVILTLGAVLLSVHGVRAAWVRRYDAKFRQG